MSKLKKRKKSDSLPKIRNGITFNFVEGNDEPVSCSRIELDRKDLKSAWEREVK